MLDEVQAGRPGFHVEILGVNRRDSAWGNSYMADTQSRLPWLQDTLQERMWERWGVVYRDVWVLDPQNRRASVYNLTEHDLSQPANRAALKALFLDAAVVKDTDHDQLPDDWEVLNFGGLAPGSTDDSDGDGANNFAEFAAGSDPRDAAARPTWRTALAPGAGQTAWRIAGRIRPGNWVTYTLHTSPDLARWDLLNAGPLAKAHNLYDGSGMFEWTVEVPPEPNVAARFLRVISSGSGGQHLR